MSSPIGIRNADFTHPESFFCKISEETAAMFLRLALEPQNVSFDISSSIFDRLDISSDSLVHTDWTPDSFTLYEPVRKLGEGPFGPYFARVMQSFYYYEDELEHSVSDELLVDEYTSYTLAGDETIYAAVTELPATIQEMGKLIVATAKITTLQDLAHSRHFVFDAVGRG